MINSDKIEEWIREVEQRPTSAGNIIRYIGQRLSELAERNEILLAENIELRSGKKVEEYEGRISALEYQLDLLKRQVSSEMDLPAAEIGSNNPLSLSLLLYNSTGQVMRLVFAPEAMQSGAQVAKFIPSMLNPDTQTGILATVSKEELLFLFDSGRVVTQPVLEIPVCEAMSLDWDQSELQEPRGLEELVLLSPVAKMSLYDFAVQASRKGYVKKTRLDFFRQHLNNEYIGTGVKLPADRVCSLAFCQSEDRLVLVSKEGFVLTLDTHQLPLNSEEALRLATYDHIVSAFVMGQKDSILIVTTTGKLIHREASWLEPAATFKTKGQPAYSQARRDAGVRVASAAAVTEQDWGAALWSDGSLTIHKLEQAFGEGSLAPLESSEKPDVEVLAFSVF